MIAISTDKVKEAIKFYKTEIDDIISEKKQAVENFLNDANNNHNRNQRAYLDKIINDFDKIVFATPSEIENHKDNGLGAIPETWRKKVNRQPSFKDKLLNALDYKGLRGKFYPKYFQKIGIKACVYCNSQLTICAEKEESVSAKFQVDHFYDKAKYPSFSISFFNLYPSCASCNNIKRNNEVDFHLYTEDKSVAEKSDFNFSFKAGSVAKYIDSRELDDIELVFKEPNGDFQKTFDIKGIYDTQKDIAEELILKSKLYSKAYQNSLVKSYPSIFTNASLNNRIIIGNYCNEDEIHNRPMSKFMQDLAKDLGLL